MDKENSRVKFEKELREKFNPKQKENLQRFFKTGPGQYGEGDVFLGIKVPIQRKISKKYDLDLSDIEKLLQSEIHEFRLSALFNLISKFENATKNKNHELEKEIYNLYLKNAKNVNNWDLVDLSAPRIVGKYLLDKPEERKILYKLAKSNNLWEKRIAILSTLAFIVLNKEGKDTFAIADLLMKDEHDLIHKAVGWMLREVGKRVSEDELKKYLMKNYKIMPRTMLRYSIERLSTKDKIFFMSKN